MARRFFIRIEKEFLKSSQIKIIKDMKNGKDYVVFYLALMLESVSTDGFLRLNELVPYNEEMLASITDTNIDIVRTAMRLFQSLGLIQILADGTIYMSDVPIRISTESESAERMRLHRVTRRMLGDPPIDPQKELKKDNENKEATAEIVQHLNLRTGKKFKATTEAIRRKVRSRMNEGFSVLDFKEVIDKKTNQWGNDPKMSMYLRPETLFGTKFEAYLNEKEIVVPKDKALNFPQRTYSEKEIQELYDDIDSIEI